MNIANIYHACQQQHSPLFQWKFNHETQQFYIESADTAIYGQFYLEKNLEKALTAQFEISITTPEQWKFTTHQQHTITIQDPDKIAKFCIKKTEKIAQKLLEYF